MCWVKAGAAHSQLFRSVARQFRNRLAADRRCHLGGRRGVEVDFRLNCYRRFRATIIAVQQPFFEPSVGCFASGFGLSVCVVVFKKRDVIGMVHHLVNSVGFLESDVRSGDGKKILGRRQKEKRASSKGEREVAIVQAAAQEAGHVLFSVLWNKLFPQCFGGCHPAGRSGDRKPLVHQRQNRRLVAATGIPDHGNPFGIDVGAGEQIIDAANAIPGGVHAQIDSHQQGFASP